MNILFLDQFSEPGGAQLALRDLMPGVLGRGWRPRAMIPGNGALQTMLERMGVPVDPLPISTYTNGEKTLADVSRFGRDTLRGAAAVRAAIMRSKIDLLYINGPRLLTTIWGLSCPIIFHAHSYLHQEYARRIAGWSLQFTDATVIAVSQFAAQPLRQYLPADRIHVIYNGVSSQWRGARPEMTTPLRIGIIGRIAPEKGQLDFVRAARIFTQRKSARFLVFGEAMISSASYTDEVRMAADGAPVEFRGWTSDIASALQEIDIVAVPSASIEASCRVIPEAMSAGVPVIAYSSGGIPELIEHGATGFLTTERTPESLAAAIEVLSANSDLRARLSIAGRSAWEQRFSVERFQEQVCNLIERQLNYQPSPISSRLISKTRS